MSMHPLQTVCLIIFTSSVVFLKPFMKEEDDLNNRPTIAILGQLVRQDAGRHSYVGASYVKFIESAGGRAVLIPTSFNTTEVTKLFSRVNGVLFPGGETHWFTSAYYRHAKTFYDLAIQANKNGDYFPIWGTCLGFEALHIITANSSDILGEFEAINVDLPLNFTAAAAGSRLFKDMPQDLLKAFSTEYITLNEHRQGFSPKTYENSPSLNTFFKVLSTNQGLLGNKFVSTVEAFDYPFYGTQWHPEKNMFEFNTRQPVPHSKNAILGAQYMANFFVGEARKSKHRFLSSEEENKYLSYNYDVTFTGVTNGTLKNLEESYVFPN